MEKSEEVTQMKTSYIQNDIMDNEQFKLRFDIYSLTLVTMINDEISPIMDCITFNLCLKTFLAQFLICYFFVYEKLEMQNF